MLQGSKLGRKQLHLLNDLALVYPVRLAQFLAGDDTSFACLPPPLSVVSCLLNFLPLVDLPSLALIGRVARAYIGEFNANGSDPYLNCKYLILHIIYKATATGEGRYY